MKTTDHTFHLEKRRKVIGKKKNNLAWMQDWAYHWQGDELEDACTTLQNLRQTLPGHEFRLVESITTEAALLC